MAKAGSRERCPSGKSFPARACQHHHESNITEPALRRFIYSQMLLASAITMIGEMVWELTGKIVGQRLLRHHAGLVKLERTVEAKGKVLGEDVTFLATTWAM